MKEEIEMLERYNTHNNCEVLRPVIHCCVLLIMSVFAGRALGQATGCDSGASGMNQVQPADGPVQKVAPPPVIYVTDFYLDPDVLKTEKILQREGVARKRLEALKPDDDPATKAAKLVSILSGSITKGLQDAGQKTEYRPNPSGRRKDFIPNDLKLPAEGWVVTGWFSKIDEGNRALNSAGEFGKGSEGVQIEVDVYDLSQNSQDPFLHMGSEGGARRTPGGLITKNPYSIAAHYVLSKGATEKDVKKQGSEIVKTLLRYIKENAGN